MATYRVKGLKGLNSTLRKHMRQREKRIKGAIKKTARQGAAYVRRNVPVAFSELRDSVFADAHRIVADAPHAAPVEEGSRPHWPPIDPIERWVKLRGMQGLTKPRSRKRLPGTTTAAAASSVAGMIAAYESGGAVSIDAPRRIAFLIARAISKRGTKPHWYMRNSLPTVMEYLDRNIVAALPDKGN